MLDQFRIFLMRGDKKGRKNFYSDGWFDAVIRMLTVVVISNEQ